MSDFPRGWLFSTNAIPATITVPATAGVAHVLDAFAARLLAGAGAATWIVQVLVTSSDGVYSNLVVGSLQVNPTVSDISDESSGSALDLATTAGASLTVTLGTDAGSPTGILPLLIIQGHDI